MNNTGSPAAARQALEQARKRVALLEEALIEERRARRELLMERELFNEGPVVLFKWRNEPGWPVDHVSPNVSDLLGFSAGDFLSDRVRYENRVHPADLPRVLDEMRRGLETGADSLTHEPYRLLRADGHAVWVLDHTLVVREASGPVTHLLGYLVDIGERMRAERELRDNAERLRAMAEASHDALIMIDADDAITFWSPAAEKLFGYSAREALGLRLHELVAPEPERSQAWLGLKEFAHSGTGPVIGTVMEFTALRKDGSTFPVERSVAAFSMGGRWYAVGSLRDITERKRSEAELARLAATDSLTGLRNRRSFLEAARSELARCRRYDKPLSLLMFDLDYFKRINDRHGHDAGDQVLTALARTVMETLRETDVPGRIGGEEFAALLPETSLDEAVAVAERLRRAIRALDFPFAPAPTVSVSLGAAALSPASPDLESLLKNADAALYRAKESGRDKTVVFEGE